MAHEYTANDDAYGHESEDKILESLVNTVKDRLNGNREERFKMLTSVHLFLQKEYNWEGHVEKGSDPKPTEELKQDPLQGKDLEKKKALTSTAILRKCVGKKQTHRSVVTDETNEINAECCKLQREVAELRKSSLVQEEKGYMKRKLQELSCMEQKCVKLTQEKQAIMEQMKAEQAEVTELAKEVAHRRSALTQTCQELEEQQQCILREAESLQENNSELKKQLESEEQLKKRKTQLQDELGVLKIHHNTVTAQSKRLEAKLLQQEPLKLQCSELEAQILNTQNIIEHTEEHITRMIREVSQASELEIKIHELWVVGKVKICQKKELEEYLARLTRELEKFTVDLPKYEEQAAKHEKLREQNVALQENIDNMKREIRKAHARSDSYKQTLKAGAGLEDKNKELSKKVQKLHKTLQTLKDVEVKHEKTKQDSDGLRTENLRLNEEIYSLEEEITSQKVLKASVKKLDMEVRSLSCSNNYKREMIQQLQTHKEAQQPLRDRIKAYGRGIANLQLEKQRLQKEYEDMNVKVCTMAIRKALETALVGEGKALETANIDRAMNICLESRNGIKLM